jgi:hypothetical protein
MATRRTFVLACAMLLWTLDAAPTVAQIPGLGSLPASLDKGALLESSSWRS